VNAGARLDDRDAHKQEADDFASDVMATE
jgi:hypothetical protein